MYDGGGHSYPLIAYLGGSRQEVERATPVSFSVASLESPPLLSLSNFNSDLDNNPTYI